MAADVGGGGSPVWLIPRAAGRVQRAEAESAPSTYLATAVQQMVGGAEIICFKIS